MMYEDIIKLKTISIKAEIFRKKILNEKSKRRSKIESFVNINKKIFLINITSFILMTSCLFSVKND